MNDEQAMVTPEAPKKPSVAQDLRDIQMLLVSGIFPGNMAPAVVKAYQHIDHLAAKIETQARQEEEVREKFKGAK